MMTRWARKSDANRTQVEDWLDEAIAAVAEGKGSDISTASMNGVAFTKASGGMSVAEWGAVLDEVIQHLDAGTSPTTSLQGLPQ